MTDPTTTHAQQASPATFVQLNPIGMDGDCWHFLDFPDAQTFRYPGHGGRARQPGWTFEQMADEVVERFPGPLDLLGLSMGGAMVGHILTRHPDRVRSAVIACSGGVARVANHDARLRTANARAEPVLQGGMQGALDANLPRWFTSFARRTAHQGVDYTRKTLLAMEADAWVDTCMAQANSEPIAHERLRAITQPVTIVAGMHDVASSVSNMAELHELIPNSRMEIIAAPHMIHLERPESLGAAIDRHFTWQVTGQRVEAILGSSGL
ncbi:MAG: 3-oxoadipate enol-lactonase [Gammaproteobacteria bacterium]|jgi:3-oxoadipate enol-lactonase